MCAMLNLGHSNNFLHFILPAFILLHIPICYSAETNELELFYNCFPKGHGCAWDGNGVCCGQNFCTDVIVAERETPNNTLGPEQKAKASWYSRSSPKLEAHCRKNREMNQIGTRQACIPKNYINVVIDKTFFPLVEEHNDKTNCVKDGGACFWKGKGICCGTGQCYTTNLFQFINFKRTLVGTAKSCQVSPGSNGPAFSIPSCRPAGYECSWSGQGSCCGKNRCTEVKLMSEQTSSDRRACIYHVGLDVVEGETFFPAHGRYVVDSCLAEGHECFRGIVENCCANLSCIAVEVQSRDEKHSLKAVENAYACLQTGETKGIIGETFFYAF